MTAPPVLKVPGLDDGIIVYTAMFAVILLWRTIRSAIQAALLGGSVVTALIAADTLDIHPVLDDIITSESQLTAVDLTTITQLPSAALDGLVMTDVVGQVLALHIVGGAAVMATIYKTMERWYPLIWIVAPGSIVSIATFDKWWFETHAATASTPEIHSCLYAAGVGFTLGVMVISGLIEPDFNSTVRGSRIEGPRESDEDVFDRLNL